MTRSEVVTWGVVALALAGVVALAAVTRRSRTVATEPSAAETAPPATPAPTESESAGVAPQRTSELLPAPAGSIGDLPCVERSGRAMKTSDLRGKFVVADCIFTRCAGVCPAMQSKMQQLQAAVKSMDDVRLLSVSVDPEHDTPQALSDYADRYGADKDRWLLVRCEMPAIQELAFDRLRLTGSRDDLMDHSRKFALIDREGRIRAYYSPLLEPTVDDPKFEPRWIRTLLHDIDVLRHEPAK